MLLRVGTAFDVAQSLELIEPRGHWRLAGRRPHAGARVKSNLLDPFHPSTRLGDRRSTVWSGSSGPPG